MRIRLLLLTALLCASVPAAHAQRAPLSADRVAELLSTPGILRNGISNLGASGDSLWVGPFLNLTTDGGQTWLVPDADSLYGTRNRVFSVDVEGDVIWAGLGFSFTREGNESVPTAGGFVYSDDGGRTFTYRFPQLDTPDQTTQVYGQNVLDAEVVTVPQQSPPYDIDYDPATGDVWVAGWASGIRRSADQGRTWQRVVLPPDNLTYIHPDSSYDFFVGPKVIPSDDGSENHKGFAVLVDETGTVWAGTAAGVNRSTDGGQSWRRFTADGSPGGLPGNWAISIEEQPLPGRNPVWMATWATVASERRGGAVTRDGGETFEQHLVDTEVTDFAFRGETVYVAGRRRGLLISDDGGASWRTVRDFRDPTRPDLVLRPDVEVLAVATTDDALWVGTDEGLFRSTDGGMSWRSFRTSVPLHPETPTAEMPDVDTYAYPNPFSPAADRFVRIRYDLERAGGVDVRIFDFGMHLVRRLVDASQQPGAREAVWDGTDDGGARVANGTYFYAVEAEGRTVWGKIMVLE